MARDIPKTQRSVMEQALSLPGSSGSARLAEMLGTVSNKAAEFSTRINVEQATIQGAQNRLEGGPKSLAPNINPVTSAYNKSFLAVDNQLNIMSIDEQMGREYLELTKPGAFNYDTPAIFAQIAKKQIQGAIQNVPPENRPEFALHASKQALNYELKLQSLANEKSAADMKASGEAALSKLKDDYTNAIRSGLPDLAQDAKEQFLSTVKDLKQLSAIDAKDAYLLEESLKEEGISARYFKRGQNDAIASPGTAEKQLYEFASKPPEDLSPTEQDVALKAYADGVNHVEKFKNEQNAINKVAATRDINNGTIKTQADLQLRANDVDAASYIQLDDHLYRKNIAETGGQEQVNNFIQRAQIGGGLQNVKTPDKVKEAAFVQLKQAYLDKKRETTGDPFGELTPQDEANVLMQLNANIPSIDARINYALSKGDSNQEAGNIAWALGMVRSVGAEKPNTIALTDKNRAIAIMANAALQRGGENNVSRAIENARATVNAKESDYIGRANAFRSKTRSDLNNAFNKVFPDADPAKDKTAFGVFMQLYESNYYMTDSDDEALEATRQKMQNTYGPSKFFREGQIGYLPLEKVIPGAELGGRVWLSNQVKLLALKIAENHKNASPDELDPASKVEWVGRGLPDEKAVHFSLDKLGQPVGPLRQEQLFLYGGIRLGVIEKKSPTGIMYRIKGQDRPVYIESDSMSRVGDGSSLRVRFYTIDPDTKLKEYVVDPKSKTGFAYERVLGLQDFLPDVYKGLTEDNIEGWANKVVIEEYKSKHKIPVLRAFGFSNFVKNRKPEVIKSLKEFKDDSKESKKTQGIDAFKALEEYQAGQADEGI